MSRSREAANRANAAKSTGPKTKKGKARSSRNAVKHGLTSRHALLPGESRRELRQLERALAAQYQDEPSVRSLVSQLASCMWRLSRIQRLEVGVYQASDAARFGFGLPLIDGLRHAPNDLSHGCGEYSTKLHQMLSKDLDRVIPQLLCLSRYERSLFEQTTRTLASLEPYRSRLAPWPTSP